MKTRNDEHGDGLSADDLNHLNRLLEQLHQADYRILGSIVLNIYKPGSQHVDRVERQYIVASPPNPLPREGGGMREERGGGYSMPEVLGTEAAMELWQKVQEAGYVDDRYQPAISRTQSAILADEMAARLGIKEKWKAFETLWNRRNMYRDYHDALDQRQSLQFRDTLKALFR